MDYVPICSAHRLPIKQWGLHAALMWSAMLLCDSRKIAVYEAVGVTRPPNATCFLLRREKTCIARCFFLGIFTKETLLLSLFSPPRLPGACCLRQFYE